MKKTYLLLPIIGLISLSAYAGDAPPAGAAPKVSDEQLAWNRALGATDEIIREYEAQIKTLHPDAAVKFSAEAGRAFYLKKVPVNGKDIACASCHTDNPKDQGKHMETGKPIKPMALSVNPERFFERDKVLSNFSKHCQDLYGKDCSPQDKGDYLTYLTTVK